MKNFTMFLAVLALMCSMTALAQNKRALPDRAEEDGETTFAVRYDGTVVVDGEVFNSMADYQRSDKFRYESRRCRSHEKELQRGLVTEGSEYRASKSASDCTNNQTVIQSEYYISNTLTIPVVFHILINDDGITGDIDDSYLISQIEILNEDFGAMAGSPGASGFDTGIRFELAGITRDVNRQWFNDRRESQYKSATGWDRDTYLNIWTNTASGYLGYAYLPDGSAGTNLDGVVLNYVAVGRDAPDGGIYDQGRTATHEVGHYLGLAHTFQGGCGGADPYTTGDLIADTNAESTSQFDCIERVTCGNPDPIHNYMDYTNDTCMDNFTMEQGNRTVCSLVNYRPDLTGGTTTPGDFPLSGSGYKVKGKHTIDLTWSGASGSNIPSPAIRKVPGKHESQLPCLARG